MHAKKNMKNSAPQIIAATEMQAKSGKIFKQVHEEKAHFVVQHRGFSIAALIPYDEYKALIAQQNLPDNREQ